MNGKIQTYIGFAIKKGSVAYGYEGILKCRKRVFVVIRTADLSENSAKQLSKACAAIRCPILEIDEIKSLKNKNCKVLAICDKSLADAILNNVQ